MKDKLALFFLSTKQCKDHESQNETVDVFHQVENKQAIIGRHRNLWQRKLHQTLWKDVLKRYINAEQILISITTCFRPECVESENCR